MAGHEGFGPGVHWNKLSKSDCERLARDTDIPQWLRVYFAAHWRLNQIAHAEFGPEELAELLAGTAGKPLSKSGLSNAIRTAKEKGLLMEDSSARCLTLPRHHATTGKGSASCREHGIRNRYQAA
ncbi:hypothetical protein GCM10010278_61670 [Streptomyces melanogenes]|nr:hypothetical protein GCM10010278_61670 [Streptomyces melanogenes]